VICCWLWNLSRGHGEALVANVYDVPALRWEVVARRTARYVCGVQHGIPSEMPGEARGHQRQQQ
jgi:hypothetical protein